MKRILEFLKKHGACKEAYKWSTIFNSPARWWASIDHPSLMQWCLDKAISGTKDYYKKKELSATCEMIDYAFTVAGAYLYATGDAAGRKRILARITDLVREIFTIDDILESIERNLNEEESSKNLE